MNHLHVSALTAVTTFLMVLLVGAFWRLVSMRMADNSLGKAMAFLY